MFYRTVRRLFLIAAAVVFRFRVRDARQVPDAGPAILVAAHRSWLDPACIGGASPRPVRFLIMDTVYHKRWARWFYRRMGCIPVVRGGARSISALREALRRLRHGEIVGVFPEGGVFLEHEPGQILPGAALLSLRSGAPLIPVDIRGSDRAWPHGRWWPRPAPVRVRFGAPIAPPARPEGGAIESLVDRIARELDELRGRPRDAVGGRG